MRLPIFCNKLAFRFLYTILQQSWAFILHVYDVYWGFQQFTQGKAKREHKYLTFAEVVDSNGCQFYKIFKVQLYKRTWISGLVCGGVSKLGWIRWEEPSLLWAAPSICWGPRLNQRQNVNSAPCSFPSAPWLTMWAASLVLAIMTFSLSWTVTSNCKPMLSFSSFILSGLL